MERWPDEFSIGLSLLRAAGPLGIGIGVVLALAIADWVSVAKGDRAKEYVFKPATTVALIGLAALLKPGLATVTRSGEPVPLQLVIEHPDPERQWLFVVLGLVLSLAGDVFLMLPRDRFVPGLGSFLGAHICYVIAFWPPPAEPGWWIVAGAVVVSSLVLYARLAAGMRSRGMGALRLPVLLYVGAISVMVAVVLGHLFVTSMTQLAALSAAVGALLFYGSDGLIGWTRFVGSLPNARVAIMITYHLGQLGLVLSLTAWLSAGS